MKRIPLGPTVFRNLLPPCAFFALLFCAQPALAALGGDASSIAADQVRFMASVRILRAELYTMHELAAATGTKVREYLDSEGKVFAVSWQGPFRPNLRQLLGSYYETFLKAAGSRISVARSTSACRDWLST